MNLIWQCWLLVWTMGEGCYMQDGFYWWLCRSMNLQVQVCEWHYHASQVEWALRICAYAHMHMWVYALRWRRTYQALPSGEMDGEGCRMKERTMTVETKPLLAHIFGWWAMFLLFFPNWVLLWWFAVLRASYGFAWLAASKERNKIWILNLFLLVSWMTMSFWFLFFQMWFYFTMMIVEHGLCVIGDGFQILFHPMKERSTSTNMHLNLFLLLVWSVMIDGGAPLWSIFPVWF